MIGTNPPPVRRQGNPVSWTKRTQSPSEEAPVKKPLPALRAILRLWRRHPVLVSGFALALALALFFALRIAVSMVYWSDPAQRDPVIEGWMPVGYIARAWDVPREVLAEALDLAPGAAPRQSLARIAAEQGVSVEVLKARLALAIAEQRAGSQQGAVPRQDVDDE